MAFLTEPELKTVATAEIINIITQNKDEIVTTIIEESISLMSSYLFKYYDTAAIFSKTAEDRSKVVIKYLKDIVIHEVYVRRTRQMNEVAKNRYDEAMLWLEKVGKGEIEPDLPRKLIDTNGDGEPDTERPFLKLGSRKNYKNYW